MSFNQPEYFILVKGSLIPHRQSHDLVLHDEWWCFMICFFFFFFSGVRPGHNELRCYQGQAYQNNVVSAWPGTQEVWCGKHLHQEHGWVDWQQGAVWYLLRLWQYFVLQGKWGGSSYKYKQNHVNKTMICTMNPLQKHYIYITLDRSVDNVYNWVLPRTRVHILNLKCKVLFFAANSL